MHSHDLELAFLLGALSEPEFDAARNATRARCSPTNGNPRHFACGSLLVLGFYARSLELHIIDRYAQMKSRPVTARADVGSTLLRS